MLDQEELPAVTQERAGLGESPLERPARSPGMMQHPFTRSRWSQRFRVNFRPRTRPYRFATKSNHHMTSANA